MLNNRCFSTFHRPLVTATQISLAMDCESRDVLMPEVREKISDRKSAKDLGDEIMPELKNFLMRPWYLLRMQLGCVDRVLK